MKSLSALLISTSYPRDSKDWRARFIADMVEGLAGRPDIRLSVWAPPGEMPSCVQSTLSPHDAQMLNSMSEAGGIAHLLRTSRIAAISHVGRFLSGLRACYQRTNSDVLHINWLQNLIALPRRDHRPVLVTVLGSDYRLLSLPGMTLLLRWKMRGRSVLIAPNADWMVPQLAQKFGDIAQVEAIPFGIEKSWYSLARTNTAYASEKWLAVARVTRNKIGNLFDWGASAFSGARSLHLLGPQQEQDVHIPSWVNYHGPSFPEALRADWFPNAAGLISLSQHDEGRPQVMLEAMATGLPIIASDLPAHRDIIKQGETGFLVKSQQQLQDALNFLSVPANNQQFGDAARASTIARFGTWDDCASRYQAAYAQLLKQ